MDSQIWVSPPGTPRPNEVSTNGKPVTLDNEGVTEWQPIGMAATGWHPKPLREYKLNIIVELIPGTREYVAMCAEFPGVTVCDENPVDAAQRLAQLITEGMPK